MAGSFWQFLAVSGSRPVSAEEGKEGAEKAKKQRHSFLARRGLTDIQSCLVRMTGERWRKLSVGLKTSFVTGYGKILTNGDSVLLY